MALSPNWPANNMCNHSRMTFQPEGFNLFKPHFFVSLQAHFFTSLRALFMSFRAKPRNLIDMQRCLHFGRHDNELNVPSQQNVSHQAHFFMFFRALFLPFRAKPRNLIETVMYCFSQNKNRGSIHKFCISSLRAQRSNLLKRKSTEKIQTSRNLSYEIFLCSSVANQN